MEAFFLDGNFFVAVFILRVKYIFYVTKTFFLWQKFVSLTENWIPHLFLWSKLVFWPNFFFDRNIYHTETCFGDIHFFLWQKFISVTDCFSVSVLMIFSQKMTWWLTDWLKNNWLITKPELTGCVHGARGWTHIFFVAMLKFAHEPLHFVCGAKGCTSTSSLFVCFLRLHIYPYLPTGCLILEAT